jgi:hypothetical protein
MKEVKALEGRVVEILRRMGEVVVYGEQNTTPTQLFDYFCEKNMLALLVDVFLGQGEGAGCARSIKVKVQTLQTVGILVGNVKEEVSCREG